MFDDNLFDDGFDQDELQAALALSMHQVHDEPKPAATPTADEKLPALTADTEDHPEATYTVTVSPEITIETHALGNIDVFRKLIFNDSITTTDDKERWIYECIATNSGEEDSTATKPHEGLPCSQLEMLTGCQNRQRSDAKPAAVPTGSMHKLWGLTQTHGGPCGILAAIQAEMIRILLFGRDFASGDNLFYPCYGPLFRPLTKEAITTNQVKQATAMAIGMILARAAVMPSAVISEKQPAKRDLFVKLVLPNHDEDAKQKTDKSGEKSEGLASAWISEMLNKGSSGSPSLGLNVHTIKCPQLQEIQIVDQDDDSSPESKRRKKKKEVTFASIDTPSNTDTEKLSALEREQAQQMCLLAQGVADYILGKPKIVGGSTDETNKSSSIPLDHFTEPGGIMFFVMSLIESRGAETIKSDMDDPNTTITSQFGHSSQELINLLLTGQAVSNVFDNSMTLGELTCRGIQQRPTIGYLSQLESLHYCEVGGYYKSPQFPIWVVGSTSHFSVLFGDAECLKESKSDQILEKCRRAFKKAEDGGESGFILVDKLGLVVDELNLRDKLGGDHGVQTLQAFLEVSGAGIILWEDAWKALSRILTGSSLESIIDTDEVIHVATVQPEAAAAAATPTMQSDEELAKKLAEEWGASSNEAQTNNAADSDEAYARKLQAEWDAELANSMDATDDNNTNAAVMDDELEELELSTVIDPSIKAEKVPRPPTPPKPCAVTGQIFDDTTPNDPGIQGNPLDKHITSELLGGGTNTSDAPDFEQYGSEFRLYHYNGLRGGTLTPFKVTRLNAAEAVGSSIGLSNGVQNHGSDDLEAVVRTKWPSCTFDWLGKQAPYID